MEDGTFTLVGFALHVASEYRRLHWKPPVTATLILTNILICRRPGPLDRLLPSPSEAAFHCDQIVKYGELKRLLAPLYHWDDTHLYGNMVALLRMGMLLESSMGSRAFASMVAALHCATLGITFVLTKTALLMNPLVDEKFRYHDMFAVGFSSVVFGMEAVHDWMSEDGYTTLYGVDVWSRYGVWLRLVLLELLHGDGSWLGHLGGALAGYLYLWAREPSAWPAHPLAVVIRDAAGGARWFWPLGRGRGSASGFWRCRLCGFDESVSVDVCGRCSTERDGCGFSAQADRRSVQHAGEGDKYVARTPSPELDT